MPPKWRLHVPSGYSAFGSFMIGCGEKAIFYHPAWKLKRPCPSRLPVCQHFSPPCSPSSEKPARAGTSSLFEPILVRLYNLEEVTMKRKIPMKLKVIIHKAKEGGYWAEVPSVPGCATQAETIEELLKNVREAVDACLSVDIKSVRLKKDDQVMEITI
ncbi:MAG: type II toxin-antitoxin system HicB family antitoxin [Candidatus Aminicenantales bacterium]